MAKFKMKTTDKPKESKKKEPAPEQKTVKMHPKTQSKQPGVEQKEHAPAPPEKKFREVKKDAEQTPKKQSKKDEELKLSVKYPRGTAGTWQERFEGVLNDVLNRLERLENTHNTLSDEIVELKENVNEIETNIHELTALYDAISAQYNPFIDLTPQERRAIGGAEVEDLVSEGEPLESELPEDVEEELALDEGERLDTSLAPGEQLDEFPPSGVEEQLSMPQRKAGYILPDIPENSLSHMTAIKWTEFMLEKVGANNIRKLLEYYRDMRWISDNVMNKILHQVMGLNTEKIEPEYDTWKMDTDDHMKTLVFIEKIKGGDVGTIHAEEVQDWAADIKRG